MLSVVVDDINMGITNIIRGDDHLNNAFRQYHLYKNIGCEIPKFTHIPLIFGIDGKKLSVVVIVENAGKGSEVAAPIAKSVFQFYIDKLL